VREASGKRGDSFRRIGGGIKIVTRLSIFLRSQLKLVTTRREKKGEFGTGSPVLLGGAGTKGQTSAHNNGWPKGSSESKGVAREESREGEMLLGLFVFLPSLRP